MPIELPPILALPEAVALREETASSRLSLDEEIDQFRLEEEEEEVRANPVEILDSKSELDRSSAAHSPQLIIVEVDSSSEEEDAMALNPRKSLRDLMAGRNKGSSSKEAPKSQLPPSLPLPPPLSTTTAGLLPIPNLKKKRKEQEVEEVVPQKEAKQQKTAKDKRAFSIDSREDPSMAEVR